jgi:hypothetical protein
MSDGAEDALRGYIKSGILRGRSSTVGPKCAVCGKPLRSVTMNWTRCTNGDRHARKSAAPPSEAKEA